MDQKRETVNNIMPTNTVDTSKLIFSLNEADRDNEGNVPNPWDQVYYHMIAHNNYVVQAKSKLVEEKFRTNFSGMKRDARENFVLQP